ncbi:MAG: hypothetical protein FWC32_07690 [Firmicutes bacterium]|nr:hypothetical protein [Bacillota bacterium]
MKKFARIVLALVLVMGLVIPVQASRLPAVQQLQTPESFDFAADFTISGDFFDDAGLNLLTAFVFGGSEIGATVTGSVVNDGEAFVQMYTEVLFGSVFGRVPVRTWLDMDFTDLDDPTMRIILELPTILRMMLAMENRAFSRQFMVLDLSDAVAEHLTDTTIPTAEELEAMIDEVLAELSSRNILVRLAQFVNVLNFAFDFSQNNNNNLTGMSLDFDVVLDRNDTAVEIGFVMEMEITNINNAKVVFPRLTAVNSVNVFELVSN